MRSFALNQFKTQGNAGFNDIYIDSAGNLAIVSDIQDIVQTVNNAIWMCLRDYDFDLTIGIPWNVLLGMKPVDTTLINYHLKQALLSINNYIPSSESQLVINDTIDISFAFNNATRAVIATINYTLSNGTLISTTTDGTSIFN